MQILTIIQQQALKPIDSNWSATQKYTGGLNNFEQLESEVEDTDLDSLVGTALLQDLQNNPAIADNLILLDGGTFTDWSLNVIGH